MFAFLKRRGALPALAMLFAAASAFAGRAEESTAVDSPVEVAATESDGEAADADPEAAQKALCTLIETAAADNGLPYNFFTRLIWKESRFRAGAVSPKGAQGIAQFMPGTAEERGLEDPFDVATAIPASARFLADLKIRFGNLGLAAAAYNAGPNRVSNWLDEDATLPFETQSYVVSITGISAETWADPEAKVELPAEPENAKDCLALAALLKGPGIELTPQIETAARAPWGVQVAGGFSKSVVIGTYASLQKRFPSLLSDRAPMIVGGRMPGRGTRAFYRARVPVETRKEGEKFCAELRAAGASCVVLKT